MNQKKKKRSRIGLSALLIIIIITFTIIDHAIRTCCCSVWGDSIRNGWGWRGWSSNPIPFCIFLGLKKNNVKKEKRVSTKYSRKNKHDSPSGTAKLNVVVVVARPLFLSVWSDGSRKRNCWCRQHFHIFLHVSEIFASSCCSWDRQCLSVCI